MCEPFLKFCLADGQPQQEKTSPPTTCLSL